MHSLLKRQIDKKLAGGLNDLDIFLNAVNESYQNYESQIEMLQRAMQISSDELFEANQRLRDEAASLKEVNKNLQSILNSMSLDPVIAVNNDTFDSSSYIKQQSIELIKINKQREELLISLEKQNKALSEYAHMVSHDLKAPLRSIDTLINWFIEDNKEIMNEANLSSLNRILLNVEKMDLLIKGILNYSSIEDPTNGDRIIDLNVIVSDVLKSIDIPANFTVNMHTKLPNSLYANDFRLKQLFQNLILNALKYNDKEYGLIEIEYTERATEHLFAVKDNGIGIPVAYQTKIFDIFAKLHNDGSSSGIGLSIVQKVVDFYGGKVWVESQENIGSNFYFTILK